MHDGYHFICNRLAVGDATSSLKSAKVLPPFPIEVLNK
jgi:hypothetical protein